MAQTLVSYEAGAVGGEAAAVMTRAHSNNGRTININIDIDWCTDSLITFIVCSTHYNYKVNATPRLTQYFIPSIVLQSACK